MPALTAMICALSLAIRLTPSAPAALIEALSTLTPWVFLMVLYAKATPTLLSLTCIMPATAMIELLAVPSRPIVFTFVSLELSVSALAFTSLSATCLPQ